jgi:Ca2+-binding RTX toxin-like protein
VSYATRDNAGVRVSLDGVANDGAYCPGAGCEGDNVAPDIEAVDGTGLGDVLIGTTGRQVFAGRAGPDVMIGGPGPDTFNGGPGHDTFTGGGGHDTVTYRSYVAPVHVTLDGRPNDGKRAELDNVAGDVETIIGRTANDTLTGNGGPNWLYGEGGDDHLNGGAGNDHLDGGPGHDSLDGGPGVDTCIQAPDPGSRVHCENWPRPRGGGRWSGDAGCAVLGGSIPLAQSFNNPRVDVQRRIADRRQAATGRLPGEVRRD